GGHRRGIRLHWLRELAREAARQTGVEREAVRCQLRRRYHHVTPRKTPVLAVREGESTHRSRDARRQIASRRKRAVDLAARVEVHRRCRTKGCTLAIIDGRRSAILETNNHESTPANVAGARVRDRERERSRHGRVNGVPAAPQDARPYIRRDRRAR